MSIQMSLNLSVKSTCLLGLEFGVTHSDKLDGVTIERSCQDRALAKVFPVPESNEDLTTSDTFGPTCFGSSQSFDLQFALVSKLLQRGHLHGGILWRVTWSQRTTPQLRSIYQARVLVRRTSDSGCSGWLTPTVVEINRTQNGIEKRIPHRKNYHHGCLSEQAVLVVSWATPVSHNAKSNGTPSCFQRHSLDLPTQASLTAWPTPHLPSGGAYNIDRISSTGRTIDGKKHHLNLMTATKLTSWPTPTAMYQYGISPQAAEKETNRLGKTAPLRITAVYQLSGMTRSGSLVEMENTGQLNPALARWLQGLPPEWDIAAIRASRALKTRKKQG